MRRIFTFGCSYTSYMWISWADIIIKEYESRGFQGINYGRAGMGNMGILHTMIRADYEHGFTDQDIIAVVWTSWNREDRYLNDTWQFHGNILHNHFYDHHFIKNYWSLEDDLIKNITAITCARKAFNLSFEGSIAENESVRSYSNDPILTCFNNIKMANNVDSIREARYTQYTSTEKIWNQLDGHPLISDYSCYANQVVCPALGITLSDQTLEWVHDQDNEFQKLVMYLTDSGKVVERNLLNRSIKKGLTLNDQLWDCTQLVNYVNKFCRL
jgi:hypothetical protein